MATPSAASTIRKTPNFDFIFGRFSRSDCIVPYFQVSMTFKDAAQYLRLVNEMPGAAEGLSRAVLIFSERRLD